MRRTLASREACHKTVGGCELAVQPTPTGPPWISSTAGSRTGSTAPGRRHPPGARSDRVGEDRRGRPQQTAHEVRHALTGRWAGLPCPTMSVVPAVANRSGPFLVPEAMPLPGLSTDSLDLSCATSLVARLEHMFTRQQTNRQCFFPDCERPLYAKGLCQSHYCQQLRTGALWPLGSRRQIREKCEFESCDKLATTRRLCPGHYNQLRKGQTLRPLRPFYGREGVCRFEGCERPRFNGGWCVGHAAQYYSGRSLTPISRPKKDCDFPGCEKPHYALGYCQGHRRQLLDDRPLAPLRERNGRHVDRGYVLIFEPKHPNARKDGYVAEHTKVMASILGRPLKRFEEVHHRNGIRSDNRPENLELWARSMQPPGCRVSDLIESAVRVLKLYRPELLSQDLISTLDAIDEQ
jgi:hypothetical protein